jgi:stearoyl-CoA desaturase (delta-9 desaturase)
VPGIALAVIVGLATCQVGLFVTTVYLHRTLAHRAIKMALPLAFVCRILVWLTSGIQPRQWAAVHRKHHAYTDVEGDPHSPVIEGFLAVQFGNAWMYRRVANDHQTVARYARDLPPDRWDRIIFDHGLVGLACGYGLVTAAIGWRLALIAWAVHIASYLMLNAAVNSVGHTFGRRRYPNRATNNQWLAWLVAGEGFHNNHHAAPTSARLGLMKGEIDPAWWFIAAARRLRWLSIRHSEPHFTRPVTRSPDFVEV